MDKQKYVENVLGLSRFPNIDKSGSVAGMKKAGYWQENDVTVQIGDYIYNLGQCRDYENAWFKSFYASGTMFQSCCKVDTNTHEVYDIKCAGSAAEDDSLEYENAVFWSNVEKCYYVYNLDNLDEESLDDRYTALREIKEGKAVWYSSNTWRTPESMLKECEEELSSWVIDFGV